VCVTDKVCLCVCVVNFLHERVSLLPWVVQGFLTALAGARRVCVFKTERESVCACLALCVCVSGSERERENVCLTLHSDRQRVGMRVVLRERESVCVS